MITWIKFSERQPEKEGYYLVYTAKPQFCGNEPSISVARWHDAEDTTFCNPDYWAEINPPGVVKVSGIHGPFNDPKTIKALEELNKKGVFWGLIPGYEVEVVKLHPVNPRKAKCQCTHTLKETPMSEKPLCKNCRWMDVSRFCANHNAHRSLVDGSTIYSCEIMRCNDPTRSVQSACNGTKAMAGGESFETCGPEGRWFEAKEVEDVEFFPTFVDKIFPGAVFQHFMEMASGYRSALTASETETLKCLLVKLFKSIYAAEKE